MKFFFSNSYAKQRTELEQAVAKTKAEIQRVNDIALTAQRLKDAAFAAARAMQADPKNDEKVQAFVAAQTRLRECDTWELAARMIRPGVVAENNRELLPVVSATLEAFIAETEKRRKEVLQDEVALAMKHGDDAFDESSSPRLRRIDSDTRQAQEFLQRLERGEDKVLTAAVAFCLRGSVAPADAAPVVTATARA